MHMHVSMRALVHACLCVGACMQAFMGACVRAWVRACVRAFVRAGPHTAQHTKLTFVTLFKIMYYDL